MTKCSRWNATHRLRRTHCTHVLRPACPAQWRAASCISVAHRSFFLPLHALVELVQLIAMVMQVRIILLCMLAFSIRIPHVKAAQGLHPSPCMEFRPPLFSLALSQLIQLHTAMNACPELLLPNTALQLAWGRGFTRLKVLKRSRFIKNGAGIAAIPLHS